MLRYASTKLAASASSKLRQAIAWCSPSRSTRQALFKLTGGAGLGRILLFAATPILTRLYGLEAFGALGVFASVVGIASVLATAKYDFAIVSSKTKGEAIHLVLVCLAIASCVGLLGIALGVIVLSTSLLDATPDFPWAATLLIGPTVFISAAYFALREYAVRESRFGAVSRSAFGQNGVKAVVQFFAGTLRAGSPGLILGEAIGRFAALAGCLGGFLHDLRTATGGIRFRRFVWSLKKNAHFPAYCLPSTLLDTVALNAPAPLLVLCFGIEAGGAFTLIWRVLTMPINLLGRSVSDVFHRKMAHCAALADESARRLLNHTAVRLLAVGVAPTIVVVLFGEELVVWALGSDCLAAGRMAELIAPWMLAQFVITPLTQTISVYRSHNYKLLYDGASLVATLSSIAIVVALGGTALQAVLALSLSNLAAYGLLYSVLRHVVTTQRSNPDRGSATSAHTKLAA